MRNTTKQDIKACTLQQLQLDDHWEYLDEDKLPIWNQINECEKKRKGKPVITYVHSASIFLAKHFSKVVEQISKDQVRNSIFLTSSNLKSMRDRDNDFTGSNSSIADIYIPAI